ncbi:hypothetical protein ALC53_10960 [Atta colombica]|uniref:Uncharacterized protein n=1 Tax=Atta colombica TaxID=520822 RepID=A0A195B1Y9_9HYME|nr:hypothetical protein ALC53_10960 [Atta colombica]
MERRASCEREFGRKACQPAAENKLECRRRWRDGRMKVEDRDGLEPIENGAPGNWNETKRGSMALSMFRSARYVPTVFSPVE